jgi:hypothetical protein
MPRRARGGGTGWWTAAALIAAALLAFWLFRASRVETPAPPAIQSGLPSIKEPSDAPAHDEIAPDEKADLERIIRERGPATPGR